MKNLLIIPVLLTSSLFASPQLSWVDEKVKEIKPARTGMSNGTFKRLKDPFIYVKKETNNKAPNTATAPTTNSKDVKSSDKSIKAKVNPEPFKLTMVMNSSALVGGNWYKKGEFINGYELIEVTSSYVTLKSKKKEKRIFLNEKNPNIKLNIK